MKKVIFMMLVLYGFINASSSCVNNNDDTVSCSDSNLMWQDDDSVDTVRTTFLNMVSTCENLDLGGYTNWRLPNINELLSIASYDNVPMINSSFLKGISAGNGTYYVSSTTTSADSDKIWTYYALGQVVPLGKTDGSYVRCVRDLP